MVDDPAREGLGGLPKQLRAGTAQYEKPSAVGRSVYEDAKQPEQPFAVLHLVNDDKAVQRFERKLGVRETCLIGRIFQVEERNPALLTSGQAAGESRLAHLPGTHEPDYGELAQEAVEARLVTGARNHEDKFITGKNKSATYDFPSYLQVEQAATPKTCVSG